MMRKKPGQSYSEWIEQIKIAELAQAQKELAQGYPPEQVIEAFTERFFQKAMHPLYKMIESEFYNQYKNESQKNRS